MSERKMATIRTISEVREHGNADALELAIIDGWQCVIRKGEFKAGDLVCYLEIDSWVPHELAPFLSKGKEPREFEGVKGERLRSIKLRGELSQGLLLPMTVLPAPYDFMEDEVLETALGDDISDILNIKKWERPLNPQLAGKARGNFPSFIPKTDQERVQNIYGKLRPEQKEDSYEITLKLDGSSTTFYVKDGHVGVCSRNLELIVDADNAENAFVKKFNELCLSTTLLHFHEMTGRNIAIQGELWGSGINGNWEGISDIRFSVFDIYDIDRHCYMHADERHMIVEALGLQHAPVLHRSFQIGERTLENLLAYADIQSLYNKVAEGIVLKSLTNPEFSFKIINNKYLLNGGE